MSNRAYASIWSRDFSEDVLIERWRAFLETVPFSKERSGFTELVIRAVDETEAPILEQDLRSGEYGADVLTELAREHAHADCAYETQAFWDLWKWDEPSGQWMQKPQPLGIVCYGSEFNEGVWKEQGHFLVDAGFEHFFTGHAGLLGFRHGRAEATRDPDEVNFVAVMSQPENLHMYQEKTQQNIRKLFDWMARIEAAIPVERYQLWSEGEDNFEARMEEILATR
ncbi:MAG TPA: hypothetical protein VKB26_15365 [Candidatus Acidoferrales bacterium]|nr:hypothetical protein [Candidatus Acidoferrales bacterium]